jgi:hypothetical protein
MLRQTLPRLTHELANQTRTVAAANRIVPVGFDDWMLALHVLSAFVLVAGIVMFWVCIVAVRRATTTEVTIALGRLANFSNAAIGIGWGGTIILGVWLAFSVGGYDIWDSWIVAAIVLWAISLPLGQRTSATYDEAVKKARELVATGEMELNEDVRALNQASTGAVAHGLTSLIVLLILVDMIWKPGA